MAAIENFWIPNKPQLTKPEHGEMVDIVYDCVMVRDGYLTEHGWYSGLGYPAELIGTVTHWAPKRKAPSCS
ncbi:hypothetical protein AGMMS49992_24160 [Clostridia bacterium]|nr:hypothetical protein AGMMS49992_24160 [Clostridia bacterium]